MKKLLQSCIVIFFVSATVFGEAVDNEIAKEIKTIDLNELKAAGIAAAEAKSKSKPIIPPPKPAEPLKKVTVGDLIKLEFNGRMGTGSVSPNGAYVSLVNNSHVNVKGKLPPEGFEWFAALDYPTLKRKPPAQYVFCRVISLSRFNEVELLGSQTKTDGKVTHFFW
jgi:hypothetical protein